MTKREIAGDEVIISVAEVKVGDDVLTSTGYQKVLYVHLPRNADALCDILEFETLSGAKLGLTGQHLVYDEEGKMRAAGTLKVNDYVQTFDGKDKIIKIGRKKAKVRSIVTMNGEINARFIIFGN